MKLLRTRTFQGLVLAAVALLVVMVLPSPSDAIIGSPPTVTGEVSCNTDTGHLEVIWTLHNASGTQITVSSAVTDDSGQTTGSALTTDVTMSPNPLETGNDATGTSEYTGDSTGDTHLSVTFTYLEADPTVDGEVVLPGGCEQVVPTTTSTTTTTEPTTTTTEAPAVAPAAVQAQPTFTG